MPVPSRKRRDYRPVAFAVVALGIAVLGYLVILLPGQHGKSVKETARLVPQQVTFEALLASSPTPLEEKVLLASENANEGEAKRLLAEARKQLMNGKHDNAIALLTAAQPTLKAYADPYLLIGNALLGKRDFQTAADFYLAAIDRDPTLADAYLGYAVATEGLGDLEQALGGMRTFLHMQTDPNPYRLKVARARSAIWEWESRLGRGAWGQTRGIPPGFTADELARDGRGAGTKMPIPETRNEYGFTQYEIKRSDKIKMFDK